MAHLPVASLRGKKRAQIQTTNETLERVILSGWYPRPRLQGRASV